MPEMPLTIEQYTEIAKQAGAADAIAAEVNYLREELDKVRAENRVLWSALSGYRAAAIGSVSLLAHYSETSSDVPDDIHADFAATVANANSILDVIIPQPNTSEDA